MQSITLIGGLPGTGENAFLSVEADPGDQVVINVHRQLNVGQDGDVRGAPGALTVLNVLGRSQRITLGAKSFANVAILAPDRQVRMGNNTYGDAATVMTPICAKTAVLVGDVE